MSDTARNAEAENRPLTEEEILGLRGFEKFKYWMHNYWYYYSIRIIPAAIAVGLIVWLVVYLITLTRPDFIVGVVTKNGLTNQQRYALEEVITAYGEDLNGDGKVVIQIGDYGLEQLDPVFVQSANAQLSASLRTVENFLFIVENNQLDQLIENGPEELFDELEGIVPYDELEGNYRSQLKGSAFAEHLSGLDEPLPETLCFMLRSLPEGTREHGQEQHAAASRTLYNILADTPTAAGIAELSKEDGGRIVLKDKFGIELSAEATIEECEALLSQRQ